MPEPMNCAHEPHDVACKTASQAWNIAESREPPVPRPPLLMHPASAAAPAATRAPANTTDVIIKRLKLRIGSLLPWAGVMKPKPFVWLKNLTVPVCRMRGLHVPGKKNADRDSASCRGWRLGSLVRCRGT